MKTLRLVAGCLVLGLLGCGGDADSVAPVNVRVVEGVTPGERVSGSRILRATAEDNSGTVARVEFSVAGSPVCVDDIARRSGSTFSCTWDSSTTPTGDHQLTVKAQDAAGNSALSSPIAITVLAANRAPTLGPVTTTRKTLDEGSAASLAVTATDPDGDTLTYSWTQSPFAPLGTFAEGSNATPSWTAPFISRDTTFLLKVTVSDGRGGSTQGTVSVTVVNVPALNQAPSVDMLEEPEALIAGRSHPFFISARDPDGDPLTYSWTTEPPGAGVFTHPDQPLSEWRSGELSQPASYTVKVTVSDGTSSETRSVPVQVGVPSYARDIEPLWSARCSSCHNENGLEGLNLLVGKSHASLMASGVGACASGARVSPGRPEESLLVRRISGEECGIRMPMGNSDYFDSNPGELTQIRSWILAGALDN
ncbi:EF hand domain/PKD domain protein [Cystobacter fuscus DSM 2262]|uniref:EF hand domain/PKD domain protein n=1 Tax=Cystobacter fuscus (strain ATCC 25194 / DSM 2262 / NBRC 100088 / M29) TaxID=1242864 RepID=S9Q6X2_CYSF2|nr:Ig-like domain-containing protein [Cystobacter fuscus]EPX57069.1 EF hand domain/PKD domain protein [Cystobacter fuscus DSM 2262]